MYLNHEIDNALVHQKDGLLASLHEAIQYDDNERVSIIVDTSPILEILTILASVRELWCVLGYGYKGHEIVTQIEMATRYSLATLHHAATKKKSALLVIQAQCRELEREFAKQFTN